jgi:hypothetical protein
MEELGRARILCQGQCNNLGVLPKLSDLQLLNLNNTDLNVPVVIYLPYAPLYSYSIGTSSHIII